MSPVQWASMSKKTTYRQCELVRDNVVNKRILRLGKEIAATLSKELTAEYGRRFGPRNLFQMVRFGEVFPDDRIVQTLSAQLSWSRPQKSYWNRDSLSPFNWPASGWHTTSA